MVSTRCKMVVKDELRRLGLHFIVVDLGEVEIMEDITPEQRKSLDDRIKRLRARINGGQKGDIDRKNKKCNH
jgi:hypothetical protein